MQPIKIDELPKNLETHASIPSRIDSEEEIEKWLRIVLTQAALNLHIPNCYLATVNRVHDLAISKKYKVFIKPIEGQTASAEFFFEQVSVI